MWSTSCPISISDSSSNSDFLREHARRLLRAARSDDASASMPVLRRILAASVLRVTRIGELHAGRGSVQLKHVLAMLAFELGYAGWDVCSNEVDSQSSSFIDRYRLDAGLFNDFEMNWFGSLALALEWQADNGGYIVRYGQQAVAILNFS
jgi:hypothetical protein